MVIYAGLLLLSAAAQGGEVPELAASARAPANMAQCRGNQGYAQDFGGRRTFLWRPHWLKAIKQDAALHDDIIRDAEKALGNPPYSVVEKTNLVPGATVNDYISIGPYWWPDTKKSSGLPYVRRDGEVNPDSRSEAFDKQRIISLGEDIKALALAYYVTGDERYARHSAKMLRTWFINPDTRMNPNMNFAQGIPGKVYGRGIGLVEAAPLSAVIEALGLLAPSAALNEAEHKVIQTWYRDFTVWMATSDNGIEELQASNNHGVFYDFYLSHFALYVGLDSIAENMVDAFPVARIAIQMDQQGRFIKELKRTRSWHYSHYVMEAAGKLATIGECVDRNLWEEALPDGRNLQIARGFLGKYWSSDIEWPFPDKDIPKKPDRLASFKSVLRVQKLFGYTGAETAAYQDKLTELLP